MSQAFDLEIVTPERVMYAARATSVNCPGVDGRFQVLHNHAPFLSQLAVGMMVVDEEDGARVVYAISGGVSQVFHNHMLILADSAERADQIDVARAEEARRRAEERLQARTADVDVTRAEAALLRAINRLKIARAS